MIVPILTLVVGAIWLAGHRPRREPGPTPAVGDPDRAVAGLEARLELEGGGELTARVLPLHGDPDRQAFDAEALRRRLGLPPGEAWRLSLSWTGSAEAADGENGGLELGGLGVRDARGPALELLPAAEAGGPPDPLRTLLAGRRPPLHPGQAVDLVLWGRAPAEGAALGGLRGPEAVESALDASGGDLPLGACELRLGDLRTSLARLELRPDDLQGRGAEEGPTGGKDGPPRSSPAGDEDGPR